MKLITGLYEQDVCPEQEPNYAGEFIRQRDLSILQHCKTWENGCR